jgi:hypothetical protein
VRSPGEAGVVQARRTVECLEVVLDGARDLGLATGVTFTPPLFVCFAWRVTYEICRGAYENDCTARGHLGLAVAGALGHGFGRIAVSEREAPNLLRS